MTKSARELNTAYDAKQAAKVRPATPAYNFAELEKIVANWVRTNKE